MKEKNTAWILALLLWWLGAHKFYLWASWLWILYLLFCWTFIPSIVALIEGISYFSMSEDAFNKKYNKGHKTEHKVANTTTKHNDSNKYDDLAKIKKLKDDKAITDEEFEKEKKKIMS